MSDRAEKRLSITISINTDRDSRGEREQKKECSSDEPTDLKQWARDFVRKNHEEIAELAKR